MCKTLRVLNAVCHPRIGMPLTYQQYKQLTPKKLIERLMNRHHHLLAWHICGYLKLKRDAVLVHWACLKVRSEGSDREILSTIIPKLQAVPAISFAEIAATAFRYNRTDLATKVRAMYSPLTVSSNGTPSYWTMNRELQIKYHY